VPRIHSFAPIARDDARVLILGSVPGVASLRVAEYYAHPRNAFWEIMAELVGTARDLPYAERVAVLQDAGIAVWDVLHSAEREGSLDSAIQNAAPNDLIGLLRECPEIGLIATNGSFASTEFKRRAWTTLKATREDLRWVQLPSTSPANARMSFNQKLQIWRAALEPELFSGV
jgi:double-stranded uracil-DNA glycosylase